MKLVMIVFLLFFVAVGVIYAKPHGSSAMEKGYGERKNEKVVIQRQHASANMTGENAGILLRNDDEEENAEEEDEENAAEEDEGNAEEEDEGNAEEEDEENVDETEELREADAEDGSPENNSTASSMEKRREDGVGSWITKKLLKKLAKKLAKKLGISLAEALAKLAGGHGGASFDDDDGGLLGGLFDDDDGGLFGGLFDELQMVNGTRRLDLDNQ